MLGSQDFMVGNLQSPCGISQTAALLAKEQLFKIAIAAIVMSVKT